MTKVVGSGLTPLKEEVAPTVEALLLAAGYSHSNTDVRHGRHAVREISTGMFIDYMDAYEAAQFVGALAKSKATGA